VGPTRRAGDHLALQQSGGPDRPPTPEERPTPKFGTSKGKIKILDPSWAKSLTDEEIEAFLEGRY